MTTPEKPLLDRLSNDFIEYAQEDPSDKDLSLSRTGTELTQEILRQEDPRVALAGVKRKITETLGFEPISDAVANAVRDMSLAIEANQPSTTSKETEELTPEREEKIIEIARTLGQMRYADRDPVSRQNLIDAIKTNAETNDIKDVEVAIRLAAANLGAGREVHYLGEKWLYEAGLGPKPRGHTKRGGFNPRARWG